MIDITANQIFDSWTDLLPTLRGGDAAERHLIYEGGGILLDLTVKRNGAVNTMRVAGQVLPVDQMPEQVSGIPVLLESGETCLRSHTNALGEFAFHSVRRNGRVDLSVVFGDRRLLITGLESPDAAAWDVATKAKSAGGSRR